MATKSSSNSVRLNDDSSSSSQKVNVSSSVIDIKSANKRRGSTFTVKQIDEKDVEVDSFVNDFVDDSSLSGDALDVSYDSDLTPEMKLSSIQDLNNIDDVSEVNLLSDLEKSPPKELIKVKFGVFVNLVANHDTEGVISANSGKDIIMDTNLLTELASSRDRREERKIPLVFLVGIAIGVVLTYIFFST